MSTKIFVNLPVSDLTRSIGFFTKLGFSFNPQFTDANAACIIVSEDIFVMLLTQDFFRRFTKKEISDAHSRTESIIALSSESREKVDKLLARALEAGGKEYRDPEEHGWMYGRSFEDLDGHQWEIVWMDESHVEKN